MDTQLKKLENPMLKGYLVSNAHKNKIPTAMPMFSGMTFSMAIILTLIARCRRHTRNKYDGQKVEVCFSSANVAHITAT